MMKCFGLSRLARVPGRTGLLAAAALGAGEPVEQVVPAEVGEGPNAERRVLLLEVHRRQLAAGSELPEVDVEEARRDVEVLAPREVDEERRDEPDMDPPQHREAGLQHARRQRAKRYGQCVRDERPGLIAVAGDLEDLGEELGGHEPADHPEDDQGVVVERQAGRPRDEPPLERPEDRDDDDDGDDILHRLDGDPQDPLERRRDDRLDEPARDDVRRARS